MDDQAKSKIQLLEELESLRAALDQWRSLVVNSPGFIAIVDREAHIQFLNRVQPGYSLNDAIGKSIYDFIHTDFADIARECLEGVFRTGASATYETIASGPGGKQIWYETHMGPIYRGDEIEAATLISTEISTRKEAEQSLKNAHDRLDSQVKQRTEELFRSNARLREEIEAHKLSDEMARALINAPTESALLVELDGTIVTLNETAAQRFGGTVEQLTGKCVWDYQPPELVESRTDHGAAAVQSGKAVRFEDERDGRHFESQVYPVFDAAGKVTQLAIYAQDITQRRVAEQKAQAEKRRLRCALAASDRQRQLTAYDIHDGIAQYLLAAKMEFQTFEQLQSQDPEDASRSFETGMAMVDRSLTEARRLIGVSPPILDELGLIMAIEHLVHDWQGETQSVIEFDADVKFDRLSPVVENAIFRIIQEGMTNACKYSNSDKIRIALTQKGNVLHISVQDWGIGCDVKILKKDGFGLESIRERARLLGGQAQFESIPGKGTQISAQLPLLLDESPLDT